MMELYIWEERIKNFDQQSLLMSIKLTYQL